MRFDWREANEILEARFPAEALGYGPWRELLAQLQLLENPQDAEALVAAAEVFLVAIDEIASVQRRNGPPPCTVFISHQSADVALAERVAWLACSAGLDYWLDVHDPVLAAANGQISSHDPRYPVMIAAIIEMALLNSSHIVVVHTINSTSSKWVPYELGRARDRNIRSPNSGGWFHPGTGPSYCGDYVRLCRMATAGEVELIRWFNNWAMGCSGGCVWYRPCPPALPD